jgi:CBS domain-containing protein
MKVVKQLLEHKGHAVWRILPDETVFNAIKLMEEKEIGALAVVLGDGTLIGILSERDYARKVILKDRASKETKVKDIMTRNIYYTYPQQNIEECLAIMTQHRIRHLPVMKDREMVGMISMGDVVREIIAEQRFMIEQLEHTLSWEEAY